MRLYKIALKNVSRNKRRSILSGSAITIATFAIVFAFGLMDGMLSDMRNNLWSYVTGAVRVRHADFDKYERLNPMHLALPNYQELLSLIEKEPGITAVSPRINIMGRVPIKGTDQKINVQAVGINFLTESSYQDYERTLVEGKLPAMGKRQALLGRSLAKKLNVGLGGRVTVLAASATRGSNAYTFTVTGLLSLPMSNMEKTMLQIPLDTAQRFLWMPNQVQEILMKVNPKSDNSKKIAERLGSQLQSSVPLNVLDYKSIDGMAGMMEISVRANDLLAIIFFLLASTVIVNTTIMVIFERMKEIGTLGAMGMTGKQLVRLFFWESLIISGLGAFLGVALGMILTGYLGKVGFTGLAKAMADLDGGAFSQVIYPVLNLRSTLQVFLSALVVSGLATWFPARRAAKITPVEALRNG